MGTHRGSVWSRFARGLVAVSALSFVLGCSVVDEVDKLGKDPKKTAAKPDDGADQGLPAVPEGSNQAKLRAYYKRSANPVEQDPGNPIVNCRIAGTTTYMRLADCELRGGKVPS
jgi:hypothetical protein